MRRGALAGMCILLAGFGLPASADAHTLSYSKAKAAVQKRADSIAHKHTRVNTMIRITRHRWYGQAKWQRTTTDPIGCKGCGYDPATGTFYDTPTTTTEYCFVGMQVKFRSRRSHRLRTALTEHVCN